MNNIGISGFGKMGRDIFNMLLTVPEISHITVYCRHDVEANTEKMQKELAKSLKRKKLTQEQYEKKSVNIKFTENIADLSECDIVIESISENLSAKQELFGQLCGIVKNDCILATNTSSLEISEVFAECTNRERCTGLHFFYPVKFSEFVEVNTLPETNSENVARIMDFLHISGKKGIVFSGCYNIYLNQIINALISKGIQIRNEKNISMKQMQKIFSDMFPMHGLFGMIDGIGLNLLARNEIKNCCERLKPVIEYGTRQMKEWLDGGCSGEPDSFFDTLNDIPEREVSEDEAREILGIMDKYIKDEIMIASAEYGGESQLFIDAVKSTIGLAENF